MYDKTMYECVKYVEILKDCKADVSVINKIEKGKVRRFGHVERMNK